MTDEEAAELVALAQSGQPLARSNVIESHRRIVARLVKRYERTDLSSDERIRLGEQGLVIAIEKFDDTKGFTFSAYATWRIRQAITIGPGGVSGGAGVREPTLPLPPSGSEAAALSLVVARRAGVATTKRRRRLLTPALHRMKSSLPLRSGGLHLGCR